MFFGIFSKNFLLLQIVFTKYCKNWWKCCRKQWKYEKKILVKKSTTLAHSGGHNLVKMFFCLFSVTMGQKFLQYAWKVGSNRSSSRERQKMATMGRYLERSSTDFFLIHVIWCLEGPQHTVGNRVVKTSTFCFSAFYSIVNTPAKKKPHRETPCYLPVLRYLPSKSKLERNCISFLAATWSSLEANISGLVRILFNIFILNKNNEKIEIKI